MGSTFLTLQKRRLACTGNNRECKYDKTKIRQQTKVYVGISQALFFVIII